MNRLAKKRLQMNIQQSLKYLVLVFNDFFILALIFLFGALMFWYAQSMKAMPRGLWFYRPLVGVIFWLSLLLGKLVTLLEPADLQFLLPQDKQLNAYLKPMLKYSLLVPTICLILLAGILFPFASIKAEISPLNYVFAFLAVFLAKLLQLKIMEHNLFFNRKVSIPLTNTIFLFLFALGMVKPSSMIIITILLVLCIAFLLLRPQNAPLFDWCYAINQEEKRKNRVYSIFSMFTDVKEKQMVIKRRKYLDFLLPKTLKHENPNKFLYRRSLIRNPENLNLLVRMTAFAILISLLVQSWSWALGLSCLVIFLTVYQLMPMVNDFDDNIMYRVYPIERQERGHDLVAVIQTALIVQWLVISVFWLLFLRFNLQLLCAVGFLLIFSLIMIWVYLPLKIKKRKI